MSTGCSAFPQERLEGSAPGEAARVRAMHEDLETRLRATIGHRLRAARNRAGLNQLEAGEVIGVSKETIANWEKAKHMPPADQLAGLLLAYGCSADYVLGRTNHEMGLPTGRWLVDETSLAECEAATRDEDVKRHWVPAAFNLAFRVPEGAQLVEDEEHLERVRNRIRKVEEKFGGRRRGSPSG